MMCHRIGRSPIGSMGFGTSGFTSLMRVPRPPQRMTVGTDAAIYKSETLSAIRACGTGLESHRAMVGSNLAVDHDCGVQIGWAPDPDLRRDEECRAILLLVKRSGGAVIRYLGGDSIGPAPAEARPELDLDKSFLESGERAPPIADSRPHGIGKGAVLGEHTETNLGTVDGLFEAESHAVGHGLIPIDRFHRPAAVHEQLASDDANSCIFLLVIPGSEDFVIAGNGRFRWPIHGDSPVVHEHDTWAEKMDCMHGMAHKDDRRAFALKGTHPVEAFELETQVPDGEYLIDEKNVGIDVNRNREA